jgi:hypothetical protein
MRPEEKFRSTFKDTFNNKIAEQKTTKPADCLKQGFDTFEFESSEYKLYK